MKRSTRATATVVHSHLKLLAVNCRGVSRFRLSLRLQSIVCLEHRVSTMLRKNMLPYLDLLPLSLRWKFHGFSTLFSVHNIRVLGIRQKPQRGILLTSTAL